MKWQRLKNMRCPNHPCEGTIVKNGGFYECNRCNFIIGLQKFDEIVGSMYRRKNMQVIDNLSELNNLGHEKVKEDFSDSKALDY